jgi:DNA (cytosine-5)-methyltransferase 1
VFVVGCLGSWESAAEVLFESESLSRNIKQSRKTRQETSNSFISSVVGTLDTECGGGRKAHQSVMSGHFIPTFVESSFGAFSENSIGGTIKASGGGMGGGSETLVYENHGTDSRVKEIAISPTVTARWGTGGNNVPLAMQGNLIGRDKGQTTVLQPVAYSFDSLASNSMKSSNPHSGCREVNLAKTLDTTTPEPSKNQGGIGIIQQRAVRRLTEVECERLQGFPDNYTNIKENCPSGARYKALGNSMAVPVMRWIGKRIEIFDKKGDE